MSMQTAAMSKMLSSSQKQLNLLARVFCQQDSGQSWPCKFPKAEM